MRLLGFDIEISNVFELQDGEDLDAYAPFDISVAATHVDGGDKRIWFSDGPKGKPAICIERKKARELLEYLDTMQGSGHALVAWNGLSFDLKWIGHVAGDARMTVEIVTEIVRRRRIQWVTRKGTTSSVDLQKLRTVEDCLGDPMPDQSWMVTPMPQEKFCHWVFDA